MATELTREGITQLLLTNDAAVGRALVVLFNRQTQSERQDQMTKHNNAIGFTSGDGRQGAMHAKIYIRNGNLEQWRLDYWRQRNRKGTPRIAKYWRQLIDAAERKREGKSLLTA